MTEGFNLESYLAEKIPDSRLLDNPDGRRALTRLDPLLFALIYFPYHLKSEETGNQLTFSDFHLDLVKHARSWVFRPESPRQYRDAIIAPRAVGKTTWLFLILPAWAAAHGHVRFVAAFSDSARQAETHLATFKKELESNQLLRIDYPGLCTAERRLRGVTYQDTQTTYYADSGFVFAVRGVDSANLGLKVGARRPDLIICDDVEPGESSYSSMQKDKRLTAIRDDIFPLNEFARVVIVGTVTMPGSIIHELVQNEEEWIKEENIRTRHYLPILTNDDGSERSLWPAKWPMEFLQSIRHTRGYKKNFENNPLGYDGGYWTEDDFIREIPEIGITRKIISIDPSVTTKKTSDPTGLAVVGYSPSASKVAVFEGMQVRLTGEDLRHHVMKLLNRHPDVTAVLVETNQGGVLWKSTFHGLPVKVITVHQSAAKEVRAAKALNQYQRKRVFHRPGLSALEEQMVAFPKAPHDDMVDAVVTAINYFMEPKKKSSVKRVSYV